MFSEHQLVKQGNNIRVQHGTDNGLIVFFHLNPTHDEEESQKQGRPIYYDREFVEIRIAGDRNTVISEPVNEDHKHRFPAQYAAFKNQSVQVHSGTPLEVWPPLSKSQVLMFKACNVHTVEQLAEVSDSNLHNLGMGARELRDKAKVFLSSATDSSAVLALQDKLEAALKQIEALTNQLNGLPTEDKKRGRPKKEVGDGEDVS